MSEDSVPSREDREGYVDLRLWGKSDGLGEGVTYPVICHLLDAGAAAEALWRDHIAAGARLTIVDALGVDVDDAGLLVAHWAALHDIGKITYEFQAMDPSALPGEYPVSAVHGGHDHVAAQWLQYALPGIGYPAEGMPAAATMVAQLLGGHHGRFHHQEESHSASPLRALGYADDAWEAQRRAHLDAVSELMGRPAAPTRIDGAAAALVCGIVIQADWLVSQLHFVRKQLAVLSDGPVDLRRHLAAARRNVPDLLVEAGLSRPPARSGNFTAAFPEISEPNGLQRSLERWLPELCDGPGLLVVAAPMGEGKTEAGLYGAEVMGRASGRNGLYLALPTMATADQMYGRVRAYLDGRVDAAASMTLLHGMAWLNTDYLPETSEPASGDHSGEGAAVAADAESPERRRLIEVTEWLQGRKRGLFADYAIGTIDQALMAALRGRHNVVRMLGLSGKTVVIDEVHAADSYMQALLTRLLTWLGRLQVPVVLLSATLHHRIAATLVDAYLKGAGRRRGERTPPPAIAYPGWLYADGRTHQVTANPEPLPTTPREPLAVSLREVDLTGPESTGRADAIGDELTGLLDEGGCAAVICTTVAEAQRTYDEIAGRLADRFGGEGAGVRPELHLLHSRFPAEQRERITSDIVRRFGKQGAREGARPQSAILVATQIIEQSLDLDLDLLITDLAPMHLLLQRAGRCWRHEHLNVIKRPGWAREPRMVVIAPTEPDDTRSLPRPWRFVYHPSLLLRTHNLLRKWAGRPVRVPEDVQELVDGMYEHADLNLGNPDSDVDRLAEEIAHRQLGANAAVPPPAEVRRDLYRLTDRDDLGEAKVATRFGAESLRVICCYEDDQGRRWLDRRRDRGLPARGSGARGAFTPADLRPLLARTIPVPASWLDEGDERAAVPEAWSANVHLRDVRLLVHGLSRDGTVRPAENAGRSALLDDERGLVVERDGSRAAR
ncbi:CRISPR-associated helicase Cas3' [Marinitenerispora sediminis]|uniref:CRISPR-associated helicase/endonuclease Cas3 n=1 Tax=Marinitenerispora sediminis TaxID=1931232 RepID=A0A368T202_9ACTN|nr:CRISPR-associated helicase Cas3' [Marinitenerispora sediminis]RCV51385.1 CRISPR-associated helicase/endonuclease Cas3 [Marinitenerispora sediminis]RCV55088.1 CRISPR-associated helicase/endonuclease Cas3 [Marinitenerispora sediminis]RCV58110.1 CRISPR-associated helicase/endonuclease Cas3 [Marinitenerispora sediminis]